MSPRRVTGEEPTVRLGPARYVAMSAEAEELVVAALAGMLADAEARRGRRADPPADDTPADLDVWP